MKKKADIFFKTEKDLDVVMNQYRTAVGEALNNEQMLLKDCPLAMAIDQEIKKQNAATVKGVAGTAAGVAGTAAGVAGVAGVAYFGPAIPLILSTGLAVGMAPVALAAAAGAAVVGPVVAVVGGKKVKEAKRKKLERLEELDGKKIECIREAEGLRTELADRRELETYAVQERLDLLDVWIREIQSFIAALNQDLQTSKIEKDKLEGELKKKNGKSK